MEETTARLWSIWVARNSAIFRGTVPNSAEVLQQAHLLQENHLKWSAKEGIRQAKGVTEQDLTWKAPDLDEVKINVDGSIMPGELEGAVAFVARDYSGTLIGGAALKVAAASAAQVEARAMLEALRWAKSFPLQRAILETDRVSLINALKFSAEYDWEARLLIQEGISLLAKLPHIDIRFGPRATNRVADWAAKSCRLGTLSSFWLSAPPQALWALLCNDAPLGVYSGFSPLSF